MGLGGIDLYFLEHRTYDSARLAYACVNAVACFTPRLFYDTVLNALAGWKPVWEDGCANWPGSSTDGQRWNENFDTFLHGLRAVCAHLQDDEDSSSAMANVKGKGKAKPEQMTVRLALVIERAERLKENLPDLLVPLTRLAELSQVDIVTILISDVRWEDIRPPLGASPEPLYIEVPPLSRQNTLAMLASAFPPDASALRSPGIDPETYNPVLAPLYQHFIATLYSICAPFTHDPLELAYIAAACWPGFVRPLLDAHRGNSAEEGTDELRAPTEDTRMRLLRLFTPTLTGALDALYPRRTHAAAWARAHAPPPDLLSLPPLDARRAMEERELEAGAGHDADADARSLPRMAKFVLVAAFLASTNPAKTDMRMFGRGPDERVRRRRRKAGSPRKPRPGTTGTAVKIPQRLLGPMPFPLDRLLAILGVLLEEHDADTRLPAAQYTLPGEYTDMEISRVTAYAQVMELASMRLLLRTSSGDKLDLTPTFKCGISYELALRLARDVGIVLNDLMWEVV
ncbi:hypothetical protein WOLCODRAFT_134400 [Wolfiporia cocos MD-104 SS10]|uniref:Origin recognition complex subunit 5 n=1 Tax=Wolfiporia cocos (strain MD-104) TaxID=742152 RepID=A0A2H3J3U1_WOLCO|nr:hypothetical protein WOLCODRAFT_134400 [Wolfiporia cocos MD-104 SS10]